MDGQCSEEPRMVLASRVPSVDEIGHPADVRGGGWGRALHVGGGGGVVGHGGFFAEPLEHLLAEGSPGLHPLHHRLLVPDKPEVEALHGHDGGAGGGGNRHRGRSLRGGREAVQRGRGLGGPERVAGQERAAGRRRPRRAAAAEAELAQRGEDLVDGRADPRPGAAAERAGGVRRHWRGLRGRRPRRRHERARRGRGHDAALGEVALERLAAERRAVVRLGERRRRRGAPGAGLLRRQDAELVRRVREEADAAAAGGAVLAGLRPVARRVEPALEHAVRELARVAALAPALAEVRARGAGVVVPPRVAAAGLLPRVRVRAVRPVVAPPARAPAHLELVHPELVAGVGVHRGRRRQGLLVVLFVRRRRGLVRRQVMPQRRQEAVRRRVVPVHAGAGRLLLPRRRVRSLSHHHHGRLRFLERRWRLLCWWSVAAISNSLGGGGCFGSAVDGEEEAKGRPVYKLAG
jgi:hypothetical protein